MSIEKIDMWEMRDTVQVSDGYEYKTIPEATAHNMEQMVRKINELVEMINSLNQIVRQNIKP